MGCGLRVVSDFDSLFSGIPMSSYFCMAPSAVPVEKTGEGTRAVAKSGIGGYTLSKAFSPRSFNALIFSVARDITF